MQKYPAVTLSGRTLPARLVDLADPPSVLYVHGELPRGAAVAIVGTRYPSTRARDYARQLARELALYFGPSPPIPSGLIWRTAEGPRPLDPGIPIGSQVHPEAEIDLEDVTLDPLFDSP